MHSEGHDPPRVAIVLLWAAVAVPLLYFGCQLVAAPSYPGYSFARDTASMLGTSASTHPAIFNTGAILTGVAGVLGAVGLATGLSRGTGWMLRGLIAVGVAANGVLALKAGLYPMPDPRHASWQFLFLPILLIAPLLLVATWHVSRGLRLYLLVNLVCLLCLMPFMLHMAVPIFAEGTMQRLFALVIFVPIGVAALVLALRLGTPRSQLPVRDAHHRQEAGLVQ